MNSITQFRDKYRCNICNEMSNRGTHIKELSRCELTLPSLPAVTLAEVRQTVMSINNSSAGWDDFPALVAKQSIDRYIEPLTCLINRSFKDGIFPSELRLARVVPIFKCGDSILLLTIIDLFLFYFFFKDFKKYRISVC